MLPLTQEGIAQLTNILDLLIVESTSVVPLGSVFNIFEAVVMEACWDCSY